MPAKKKPPSRRVKAVEPDEILMPEETEEEQPRLAKRKHTIETEFEEIVPIDEAGEVITDDDEDELPEVEERKAYVRSERERIRAKLKKAGISSNQPLRLRCDRLPNYKLDGASGTTAEKAFCFSIDCDENFVANGENLVMEIQKRCGPGDYWMTLRYKNSVLDQWKETIAAPQQQQPVMMPNPNDPTAPPVMVYMPPNGMAQPQQPVAVIDPIKQMKDTLGLMKTMREALGPEVLQPQQQPAAVDAQSLIAKVTETKAFVTLLENAFSHDKGPGKISWTDVAMEAIKNGEAAKIVETGINGIFNGFGAMVDRVKEKRGGRDEQREMVEAQAQTRAQIDNRGQGDGMDQAAQAPQEQGNSNANPNGQAVTPEVQIMNYMIDAYLQRVPMRALIGNLRGMAEINPSLPDMLGGFAEETPESLSQFVTFLRPDLTPELQKPEAARWIANLQAAINKEWAINEDE